MNKSMMISVVTPSFNHETFLPDTLLSVLSQEGDFYLDYLVIDGGSQDRSTEIIRHFEEKVATEPDFIRCRGVRFRWLSEKDQGQTEALKKGFQMAEGEVFAWLNSDDVYSPGTLHAIAEFFRGSPEVSLVYGDAYFCDTNGGVNGKYPTENFDFNKLAWRNYFCQPSTFFRRDAFEAVKGLDETLQFAMDYDLFIRIAKFFRCEYLPKILSKYRLHEFSKTIRPDLLYENHEETLKVSFKYYNWAPINLVYGASYYKCLAFWPSYIPKFKPLILGASLLLTIVRSLYKNHGLRKADLQLINWSNIRKLFQSRDQIIRG